MQRHALLLTGAAPGKQYVEQYAGWTDALYDILTTEYGYADDRLTALFGRGADENDRIDGPCRLENIREEFQKLQHTTKHGDQVFICLIGQSTVSGRTVSGRTASDQSAKFNIIGPDITGEEFAALLATLPGRNVIVVNTTTVSAPFCRPLSGPGRIIISATRSGTEKYDTRFPEYFIAALKDRAADRDKNRRVSLWEALDYASRGVTESYEAQDRLPTEHATLDDNGDGEFNVKPDPAQNDGQLAQIAFIDNTALQGDSEVPAELQALDARRRELERNVTLLRSRKAELPEDKYQVQLESLLIELARVTRDLKSQQSELNDVP